jgi:hypothetical protein
MDQISYVHDSTSNLIFLDNNVTSYEEKLKKLSYEQYTLAAKTISASALILELDNYGKRYYYRPFGRNRSLLIGVIFYNGIWKVKEYFENPPVTFLIPLFKKYLLQSGITLYSQHEIAEEFFGSKEVIRLGYSAGRL